MDGKLKPATGEVASSAAPASKPVSAARAATVLMIGIAALTFIAAKEKLANFEPATSAIPRVGE